jgi:hypothetical protein
MQALIPKKQRFLQESAASRKNGKEKGLPKESFPYIKQ